MIKNLVIPVNERNFSSYIEEILKSVPEWEDERKIELTRAIDEGLVNAQKYASGETINVAYKAPHFQAKLVVLIQDKRNGFSSERSPDPTLDERPDIPNEREVSAIESFADEAGYHRGNLTMAFYRFRKDEKQPDKEKPRRSYLAQLWHNLRRSN